MLVGLVGAPNAGKSTFLKAATLKDVEIADYPFTTIEPNESVGFITTKCVCKELNVTCEPKNSVCEDGIRHIPVRLLDVAGLVPDAHKGRGRGVEFLNDLSQASALIHVVDISGSTDVEGKPCEKGGFDPVKTIAFLGKEIDHWMLSILMRGWSQMKTRHKIKKEKPEELIYKQLSGLSVSLDDVKHSLNDADIFQDESEENMLKFVSSLRKKSKPVIIAANKIDLPESEKYYKQVQEAGIEVVPCSCDAELALKKADESGIIRYVPGESDFEILKGDLDWKKLKILEFIKEGVLKKYSSTGVQKVLNSAAFDLLDMIVVYPVENENRYTSGKGNILPDAMLVPKGTTAKKLAGLIHSDFEDKFVAAIDARTKRKVSSDHVLNDRDIIKISLRK